MESLPARFVLGMRVDATSYDDAAERVVRWAAAGESRYVCVATVHMVMESYDEAAFRQIVNGADLVTPDGMPIVWALRMLGIGSAGRVYGPDLTPVVCARASRDGIPVGFYGGTPKVLRTLTRVMVRRFPKLEIAYSWSPPFRSLTEEEEDDVARAVNASGARILFVGLGCPKQEQWMARQRGRIGAVMLGVGAAFDFLAGTKTQAPRFVQDIGMEWCFRLLHEPRRLWRRYWRNNPRFVALFAAQMVSGSGRPGRG